MDLGFKCSPRINTILAVLRMIYSMVRVSTSGMRASTFWVCFKLGRERSGTFLEKN